MFAISQFYVLSPRGDTILTRDFRGDVVKGTAEIFFRRISLSSDTSHQVPIFHCAGLNYLYIKKNGLYFVCTAAPNSTPPNGTCILELLTKIARVFADYCGTLSEEAIRKNFILLYELLDEICDCGYPQTTSTEQLKLCVQYIFHHYLKLISFFFDT